MYIRHTTPLRGARYIPFFSITSIVVVVVVGVVIVVVVVVRVVVARLRSYLLVPLAETAHSSLDVVARVGVQERLFSQFYGGRQCARTGIVV